MGCNVVQDRVWCIVQEEEERRSRKEGDGRQTGAGQSRSDQFLARKGLTIMTRPEGPLRRLRLRGAGYLGVIWMGMYFIGAAVCTSIPFAHAHEEEGQPPRPPVPLTGPGHPDGQDSRRDG